MMKYLILTFLFFPFFCFSQYSTYYNIDANINKNVNVSGTVNKNINVSGNVKKTVTTIDYGALANANAIAEQNRLARLQYANEREKSAVLAIAKDPAKAYDYGIDNNWKLSNKMKKSYGWKKPLKYFYHKIPHKSLFIKSGSGYTYENTSDDGITTQITIYTAFNLNLRPNFNTDIEGVYEYSNLNEGEIVDWGDGSKAFLHKKDINRANVGGLNSFCGTLIWEDKYEKVITDNYSAIGVVKGEKYLFSAKVRYKGDSDLVTFEQLEGRRYYFKTLVKKITSTMSLK